MRRRSTPSTSSSRLASVRNTGSSSTTRTDAAMQNDRPPAPASG
jgi:hypothetical protein